MKSRSTLVRLLIISIASFGIMSITFMLMPLDIMLNIINSRLINIIIGIIFWLGLLIGTVSQLILSIKTKPMRKEGYRKPGLLVFFSNRLATAFDLIMIISLIGLAVSLIATNMVGYSCYVFLSLTVLSFVMHCIFNGQSYKLITGVKKEKNNERKDENE